MAVIRLDADERRKAIVAAAVPLFARKGFAGTTTKELAEAAGISEALLYRHFPSKAELYREILRLGCEGDPALERLTALPPSTATLIHMTRFMIRHFVAAAGIDRAELETRLRLVLNSCREDGEYARLLFETIFARIHPQFAASLAAAEAAGDLRPSPIATANRFWFGQHVAAMIAFMLLPGRSCIAYAGDIEALIDEASWFVLRGIGLEDAASAAGMRELPELPPDCSASPDTPPPAARAGIADPISASDLAPVS